MERMNSAVLLDLYNRLLKNPHLVKELTEFQFDEVKEFISKKMDAGSHIVAQLMMSPDNNPINIEIQKKIQIEQHRDFLNTLIEIRNAKDKPGEISEAEEEILFEKDIEKIVLLYELGIIEFLICKFGRHEPGEMHKLIYQFTEINVKTIKKYLQRIEEKHPSLNKHFNKAKLRIGDVKPTSEVLKQ